MNIKAKKYVMRAGVILTLIMGIGLILYAIWGMLGVQEYLEYYAGQYDIILRYVTPYIISIVAGILDVYAYIKLKGITAQNESLVNNSISNMEGFTLVVVTLITAFPVSILTFLPYICITER